MKKATMRNDDPTMRLAFALARAYSEITSLTREVPPHVPTPAPLSPREISVLTLLAQGLRRSEVAAELGLSEDTIKTHMARMKTRWGARTVPHLVAMAKDARVI